MANQTAHMSGVGETTASLGDTLATRRRMAIAWLLNSGICITDPADPNHGAVHSHYDRGRGCHELIYAEATGYALSLLSELYGSGSTDRFLDRARMSAGWLVRWAERHGGIIAMGIERGEESAEAYTFDNGICCKGFLDLYRVTGDREYLRSAERIAGWLIENAICSDGSVRPIFDLASARFREDPGLWYKISGSFQAKIAMPLLDLSTVNRDQRFRDAALRILEWAIGQQHPDGSFPANKMMRSTYLHFHWYTVEALLYAFARERADKFITAAQRAIQWALARQGSDGTFPRWVRRMSRRESAADVQAQAVRSFALMNMLRPAPALRRAALKALSRLLELQLVSGNDAVCGGFGGGSITKYRVVTKRSPEMTSWATMFSIQALEFLADGSSGDFYARAVRLF